MNCTQQVLSEDYLEYLLEYTGIGGELAEKIGVECVEIASYRFAVIYEEGEAYSLETLTSAKIIPHCYGLLSSEEVLESTGVTRVRRQPGLSLYGQGVIIGFVDTGIDYSHPAFVNEDGTSRIKRIWDQTIYEGEEYLPEGLYYGREYTQEDINRALESDAPLEIVSSVDTNGHGTMVAGIACGNSIEEEQFSGIAPLAQICVVKCREAKQNLKDYYRVETGEPCYAESDIMLAVRYLWTIANREKLPIVICLGMGTSLGSHNRGGILGEMLQGYGDFRETFIVTGGGNEGNTSHHYYNPGIPANEDIEIELRVGEKELGFTMELWADAPNLYSVALTSPDGEYSGKTQARLGESRRINFVFGNTVVYVEYLIVSNESGDECVRIRFQSPVQGIWRLRVFNERNHAGRFDIWLPIRNFVEEGTYFLTADPNTTLCDPANNVGVITCSYYNSANRSVAIESGRGYTRDGIIKPDFAAPGINIYGPLPFAGNYPASNEERNARARYAYRSGSSMATAVTAGTAALLAEWGIVRGRDITIDSSAMRKYFIRGANPSGMQVPNTAWGNGTLDLYGVFESFR